MASYTEANVQAILPNWYVLKWTAEPNTTMVKDLVGKCYTNGAYFLTKLVGGKHGNIRDFMYTNLYATVSSTLFAGPMVTVLSIPPTATQSQPATHKRKHKKNEIIPQLPTLHRRSDINYSGHCDEHVYRWSLPTLFQALRHDPLWLDQTSKK